MYFLMSIMIEEVVLVIAGDQIQQLTYNLVASFFHFAIIFYLECSISKTIHAYTSPVSLRPRTIYHVRHIAMNMPVDLMISDCCGSYCADYA